MAAAVASQDQEPTSVSLEDLHEESFAWALACSSYRHDRAQECLQAAYLKVLDGSACYDGRSSYKTWLFAIIRNTARDHARRATRTQDFLSRWIRRVPPIESDRTSADQELRRHAIRRALRALPVRQREVIELVFYHQLTIEEAASVMQVALGTARTHYKRGKSALQRQLGGSSDEDCDEDCDKD